MSVSVPGWIQLKEETELDFTTSWSDLKKDAEKYDELSLARLTGWGDETYRRSFYPPDRSGPQVPPLVIDPSKERKRLDILPPGGISPHDLKISPLGKGAKQLTQIAEKKEK